MSKTKSTQNPEATSAGGLGTFGGVFTPSILTILGVIMYLRFGWVVGNVGLTGTLIIVTLATSITLLTSLSISAIATDKQVGTGGAYYMISRSLGIESGGAIGIPLFFAQAISVALYTVGFAESVVQVFPALDQRWVGIITAILVTFLALRSAETAIKSQFVIMGAIVLSLISLAFGSPVETPAEVTAMDFPKVDFWTVFAVFFPAVTGIMAGVNMSGDLKDPSKSIPTGTLVAVGAGYVIYMVLPVLLIMRVEAPLLISDPLVMQKIAFWGDAVLLGVWGATLSSALGSILGAPRVLQALARDGVLPNWMSGLGKGIGIADEPRNGTIATLALALVAIWFGDLDLIAPVLSMFFLTTYGVLNIVAGLEKFLGNPSFRPRFRIHWIWSALGAVGCIAVMVLINALATLVAFLFVIGIYIWLEKRELQTTWGDVRRGLWMVLARESILRVGKRRLDAKNWRPHILVFSGAPTKRWHLVELAAGLAHNRALLTVSTVLPDESISMERLQAMERTIDEYLTRRGVQSLVRVLTAPDPFTGGERLVRIYGLGALAPNTILLGASESVKYRTQYCNMIKSFYDASRNVAVMHHNEEKGFGNKKRIDVWWSGLKKNGGLMMVMAYMLQTSLAWRRAEVRIRMIVPSHEAVTGAHKNLERLVEEFRMAAVLDVLVSDGRSFQEVLHSSSDDTDLIFMGMAPPGDHFEAYYTNLQSWIPGLPTSVFVLAAENMTFGEVLVEKE